MYLCLWSCTWFVIHHQVTCQDTHSLASCAQRHALAVCIHSLTYVCMHAPTYIRMYVCMYVCMYAYSNVCTHRYSSLHVLVQLHTQYTKNDKKIFPLSHCTMTWLVSETHTHTHTHTYTHTHTHTHANTHTHTHIHTHTLTWWVSQSCWVLKQSLRTCCKLLHYIIQVVNYCTISYKL
jgi:hypothetical protein